MRCKALLLILTVVASGLALSSAQAADKPEPGKPDTGKVPERAPDSARVDGLFVIPADHADIQGMTVKVILYEYDPFLADAGADKLDELDMPNVVHKKGKATSLKFTVGKDKKIRGDRKYYLSVRGYRGKEYVYYGTPSQGGIGKVLGLDPIKVKYTGKRMKP